MGERSPHTAGWRVSCASPCRSSLATSSRVERLYPETWRAHLLVSILEKFLHKCPRPYGVYYSMASGLHVAFGRILE